MFSKKVQFIIDAQDNASAKFKSISGQLQSVSSSIKGISDRIASFAKTATIALTGLTTATVYLGKKTVDASIEMQNALMGLTTVARAFGVEQDRAKQAAIDLAKDGLMSVSEAANGLKNLLASKFNLPEAINLMNAFKDSAAFNRQASLGFGEAIRGATEGIKNQNSILVDNAGITKNLSIILKEAGYSIQDLQNVTTDAGVRQALYNGLLKEASIFQGDAGRASETLGGKISQLSTAWFNLKVKIGDALSPVVIVLLQNVQQAVEQLGKWILDNQDKIVEWGRNTAEQVQSAINWFREHQQEIKQTWEVFKLFGSIVLDVFKAVIKIVVAFQQALETVFYYMFRLIDKAKEYWGIFKEAVIAAFMAIKDTFSAIWVSIKNSLVNGINFMIEKINALIGKINKVPGIDVGKIGELDGERASGGPVAGNGTYLVGEQGPELFTPNQSGTIIPNHAMGSTFNFTFNGDISDKGQLISEIKQAINRELELSRFGIS